MPTIQIRTSPDEGSNSTFIVHTVSGALPPLVDTTLYLISSQVPVVVFVSADH